MIIEITCPFCQLSKRVPSEKVPDAVKWVTCPQCRQRFEFNKKEAERAFSMPAPAQKILYQSEQQEKQEKAEGPARRGAPWENRSEIGLWQGIFQTCKEVLFSPETLFKKLTYEGGKGDPLAFGLLTGSIGGMLGIFWQSLIPGGLLIMVGHSLFSQFAIGIIALFVLAMIPLMIAIGIFIYSGILHLLLRIAGGGTHGFEATFRVVSYSQAAQLVGIIPFIGGWIGGIWQLIIQIIGLREIHETSYPRVILAFVIPLFVGILFAVALIVPLVIFLFRQPLGQVWS